MRSPSRSSALDRGGSTDLRLVVITDPELARPRGLEDVVRAALAGGAPAIQLRDKRASARSLFDTGRRLLSLARDAGALFIVNDRVDVALALGADGVHVGPDDVPVAGVRAAEAQARAVGARPSTTSNAATTSRLLVGASADDPSIARRLVADGADYIGCGTVYPTATKADAGRAIGLLGLQAVVDAVAVPVVAIGGIDAARSAEIAAGTGAAGVAVVGAAMRADDVEAAVRALLAPWATST